MLRPRKYELDYLDPELGRGDYAQLGAGASACLGCAQPDCLGSCPVGLDIPTLTRSTHRMLGTN